MKGKQYIAIPAISTFLMRDIRVTSKERNIKRMQRP